MLARSSPRISGEQKHTSLVAAGVCAESLMSDSPKLVSVHNFIKTVELEMHELSDGSRAG